MMGSDCVQRVMAAHMLEHWEWALVAKLTTDVKRIYTQVRPLRRLRTSRGCMEIDTVFVCQLTVCSRSVLLRAVEVLSLLRV